MVSKLLKVQMVESSVATAMTKRRLGNVMCRNLSQPLAPSMDAASYISASMADMPASMLTVKKGMPAHTLTTTTDTMASWGSASHDSGLSINPVANKIGLRPPKSGS